MPSNILFPFVAREVMRLVADSGGTKDSDIHG